MYSYVQRGFFIVTITNINIEYTLTFGYEMDVLVITVTFELVLFYV